MLSKLAAVDPQKLMNDFFAAIEWLMHHDSSTGKVGITGFCYGGGIAHMLATQRPAHVVNTASIGGFQVNPNFLTAAYSMTKYAVVALSEGLHNELQGTPIGVSILAPAAVDTRIHLSERSRPERLGGATVRPQKAMERPSFAVVIQSSSADSRVSATAVATAAPIMP